MSSESSFDWTAEEPGVESLLSSPTEIDEDITDDGMSVIPSSQAISSECSQSDQIGEWNYEIFTADSTTEILRGGGTVPQTLHKTPAEAVAAENIDLLKEIIGEERYQRFKAVIQSDRFCELKEQFEVFDVPKEDGPYWLDYNYVSEQDEENDRDERESERETRDDDEQEFKELQASIENEQTALNKAMLVAISTNQLEALDLLLHTGADINAFDKWYPTVHTIVEMGSVDMFQIAKDYVRDLTIEGHYGNLLHAAVKSGSLEMLQMVYKSGVCQFFGSTADGSSPLHVAVRNIPYRSAETHQDKNRDEKVTVEINEKCIQRGNCEKEFGHMTTHNVANDVLSVADKPGIESSGLNEQSEEPPEKISRRDLRIINFLLSKGFLVDYVDNKMKIALHEAAILGYRDVVQVLLNAGADKRALDGERNTPWLYAALYDHRDLYDMLIDSEDINKPFGKGLYYVHLACQNGNHKALSYILDNGGDVTIANRQLRERAITMAVEKSYTECLRILLNQPDPKSKNPSCDWNKMYTTFFCSALNNFDSFKDDNEDILELFLKKGADISKVIDEDQLEFNSEPLPMLDWVLNHGADPNYVDNKKGYPLLYATNSGYSDGGAMIRLLLRYNADITMTDRVGKLWIGKKGLTPLQTAIDLHNFKLTHLCLAAGFSLFKVHKWLARWLVKRECHVREIRAYIGPDYEEDKDPRFEQLLEYIKEAEYSPMNLMALSRLQTLKCVGAGNTKHKIQQLEIPLILKEYLDWDKYLTVRINELNTFIAKQLKRKQERRQ